jgi:hypothetical protein
LDSDLAAWVFVEVICLELGVLVECFLELGVGACISCVLNFHNGDVGICEGPLE